MVSLGANPARLPSAGPRLPNLLWLHHWGKARYDAQPASRPDLNRACQPVVMGVRSSMRGSPPLGPSINQSLPACRHDELKGDKEAGNPAS
eukprot:1157752-Pelagomonas_calceolata.AAC.2